MPPWEKDSMGASFYDASPLAPSSEPPAKLLTISVTADDIANGKPARADCCPIALAARRAGIARAFVADDSIESYEPYVRRSLPSIACRFIEHFDGGLPVDPFEFEIEVQA